MKNKLFSRLVLGVALLPAGGTLAALPEKPPVLPETSHYIAYAIAALLVGIVAVGAFKSARRTHLD